MGDGLVARAVAKVVVEVGNKKLQADKLWCIGGMAESNYTVI